MYHAKVPSKTGEKFCSQGKTVLKYSSWNLSPEMLPKTPSTVSKHSSEKQRLNVLPTTPSMIRKQKVREKECLLKSYRREMLLETPLKVVIDKNFFGKARQKITIKKICPKSKRSPTLLFQRKPYWIFRWKVPFKGAVQNTGKNLLQGKDCNEILIMNFFCTEKLPKTPSTVSKHSCEKYRTKSCPLHRQISYSKKDNIWMLV